MFFFFFFDKKINKFAYLIKKFASAILLLRQIEKNPRLPQQKLWQLLSTEANFNGYTSYFFF